ncbi:MAG: extensin family protein [Pseudomonadota bacterium]
MQRVLIGMIALVLVFVTVVRPEDIPEAWQPWAPLNLDDRPNAISRWKLRTLGFRDASCRAVLAHSAARMRFADDFEHSAECHIRNRIDLRSLHTARLSPVETRCEIAVRLYLWERHDLQPAARRLLGADVRQIHHFSSYSCRPIRTFGGNGGRMSEHATANAIDISGFSLDDGRRIDLVGNWEGDGPEAQFMRAARDGLCRWFNVVLSPDYNALHRDHFHADMGRFLTCH